MLCCPSCSCSLIRAAAFCNLFGASLYIPTGEVEDSGIDPPAPDIRADPLNEPLQDLNVSYLAGRFLPR